MQEKRIHARIPCQIPAQCIGKDGTSAPAVVANISVSGMYLTATHRPALNTPIEIRVRLPGASTESALPAVVRWAASDGFGVQFGLLGARETHLIAELVRK